MPPCWPHDLDEGRLQQLLGSLMSHQVEFGDLYFQRSWHESWMLEDGIVKDGSYNIDQGWGCAPSAAKTGFAYSDELSLLALQQSVTAARGIAAAGAHGKVKHGLAPKQTCSTRRWIPCRPSTSSRKLPCWSRWTSSPEAWIPPSIR